jgi:hypothetical protein
MMRQIIAMGVNNLKASLTTETYIQAYNIVL